MRTALKILLISVLFLLVGVSKAQTDKKPDLLVAKTKEIVVEARIGGFEKAKVFVQTALLEGESIIKNEERIALIRDFTEGIKELQKSKDILPEKIRDQIAFDNITRGKDKDGKENDSTVFVFHYPLEVSPRLPNGRPIVAVVWTLKFVRTIANPQQPKWLLQTARKEYR